MWITKLDIMAGIEKLQRAGKLLPMWNTIKTAKDPVKAEAELIEKLVNEWWGIFGYRNIDAELWEAGIARASIISLNTVNCTLVNPALVNEALRQVQEEKKQQAEREEHKRAYEAAQQEDTRYLYIGERISECAEWLAFHRVFHKRYLQGFGQDLRMPDEDSAKEYGRRLGLVDEDFTQANISLLQIFGLYFKYDNKYKCGMPLKLVISENRDVILERIA